MPKTKQVGKGNTGTGSGRTVGSGNTGAGGGRSVGTKS